MTIEEAFSGLEDYRREQSVEYPMIEIVMISLCSIICCGKTWKNMESFGLKKKAWLQKYLELKNGIPCDDTFNRFFANICPVQFESCFVKWINSIASINTGEVISLDGKTIRGAKEYGKTSMIHMVSAWAEGAGLSLGQVKVDQKSNEITAIPELLKVLDIEGCFVTIDAMGCQTDIADLIDDKGADYVLSVKENQKELYDNIIETFRFLEINSTDEHIDSGHGRVEKRTCKVIADLSHIDRPKRWANLKSLVLIESERYIKSSGETQKSSRYYISNSVVKASKFNKVIRGHWAIENNLHWQLDVTFNEDQQRKRAGNAAQNFSVMNKIVLTLLKQEKKTKDSIADKRLNAALDQGYLEKILIYAR